MTQYQVTPEVAQALAPTIQQVLTAGYLRGWSKAKTFQYTAEQNNMKNGYSKLTSVYNYMVANGIPTTVIG